MNQDIETSNLIGQWLPDQNGISILKNRFRGLLDKIVNRFIVYGLTSSVVANEEGGLMEELLCSASTNVEFCSKQRFKSIIYFM